MEAKMGDLSLYFKVDDKEELLGTLGPYVEYSIVAGDSGFEEFSNRIEQRFDSKRRE